MKSLNKTAIGIAISLTLGVATAAYAQPGQMGGNLGQGMQGGQHQGMQHDMKEHMQKGMNHDGAKHAKHSEAKGHGEHGSKAAQSLATPEERSAMHDKMRAAKTPEERQQIAMANRAEMQKRATEKGITLPEHRGPQGRGMGPNTSAPATTEHQH